MIEDETNVNDELGDKLIEGFKNLIRPTEVTKCRTYITDVGHITGLLLSLSKRLLRTENRLGFFTFDYIDKVRLRKITPYKSNLINQLLHFIISTGSLAKEARHFTGTIE